MGTVRIPRPASSGGSWAAGARGFRLGEVASRRLASAPPPPLLRSPAGRPAPSPAARPPALPERACERAWRRRRALRFTGLASAAGGREEAGRRAGAGEEAGLRRAVAGAERGGRAAGTRLAWLAASARTSAPQPRVSPALGFGSAAAGIQEPAEPWTAGTLPGDRHSFCNLLCCRGWRR